MATNISQLGQFSASFSVVTNADWRDVLQFVWAPGTANAGQPLDITGISFRAQLRATAADAQVLLDISTTNSLFVVDGQLGQLAFAVPEFAPAGAATPYQMAGLPAGITGVMDIIASGDGQTINLGQYGGPFEVAISTGVTRR